MNKMNDKNIYLWAIISKISIVLITIFTTALINRTLGVELKGEYAYIINVVTILEVIFSFGIGITYGTFKRKDGNNKNINIFVSLTIIISTIVGITSGVLFCFNNKIAIILLLTSLTITKNNFLTLAAIEDVKKRDKENIYYKITYMFLILIVYIFTKENIIVFLLLYLIDCFIVSLGIYITYKFKIINIKKLINDKNIKTILKLGIISMQMQLLISFNYNLDIILLKKMSNIYYVGIYSVATFLSNMLWIIPDAFKDVLYHKTSKSDSIKDILFLTKLNLIIALLAIIAFSIFGKMFIKVLYGSDYIEAFYPTLVLFVGGLSMIVYKMIHPLYVSVGKQKVVLTILLISVMLNTLLNIILIPKYNIYGASISSVFSYTLCSLIFVFIFKKDYNIKLKELLFLTNKDYKYIKQLLRKVNKHEQN